MQVEELFEVVKQPRIEKGIEAQDAVIRHLSNEFEDGFELVSQAGASSKVPDIIANINGDRTQIEVKGRSNPNATVKIYEKSVKRGQKDRVLDAFARAHSNGAVRTFTEYVDLLRQENTKIGFPGDPGVTAIAGKFYVPADDAKTRSVMRKYIMDTLHNNADDYFAIYTFNNGQTDFYDTGSTNQAIPATKLPNIRVVRAETYGSAYKGAMRIAIKVIFRR